LTCRFVSAKGLGDAILHRNREAFVHLKKVAKMSENDHKSPSLMWKTINSCISTFSGQKDFKPNSHTASMEKRRSTLPLQLLRPQHTLLRQTIPTLCVCRLRSVVIMPLRREYPTPRRVVVRVWTIIIVLHSWAEELPSFEMVMVWCVCF